MKSHRATAAQYPNIKLRTRLCGRLNDVRTRFRNDGVRLKDYYNLEEELINPVLFSCKNWPLFASPTPSDSGLPVECQEGVLAPCEGSAFRQPPSLPVPLCTVATS